MRTPLELTKTEWLKNGGTIAFDCGAVLGAIAGVTLDRSYRWYENKPQFKVLLASSMGAIDGSSGWVEHGIILNVQNVGNAHIDGYKVVLRSPKLERWNFSILKKKALFYQVREENTFFQSKLSTERVCMRIS